jgi:threonine 3-dehydrogenase
MVFDDSRARADWGWNHRYDLSTMVETMFQHLLPKYSKATVASEAVKE